MEATHKSERRVSSREVIQKKICLIGAPSVGKTSLVARYVHSFFAEKYLSTVGVKIDKKVVQVKGRDVALMIWDLAGDDDFQPLNRSYLRGAAGYLLVSDASRASTLERAIVLQNKLEKIIKDVPFVLVVNKSDLTAQWATEAPSEARLLSKGWALCRTSAKDGSGVEKVFTALVTKMLEADAHSE